MRIFKFCMNYLMKGKSKFILYLMICFILSIIVLCSPYITAGFIDSLVSHHGMDEIYKYCGIFVCIAVARLTLGYGQSMLYTKLHMSISYMLNKNVIKHVQNMSVSYIDQHESAYLNQIINGDSNTVISFCLTSIHSIISNIITLSIPLIILYRLNFNLTFFLALIMLIYIIVFILMKKPLYASSFNLSEAKGKFVSKLLEQLNLLKFIKTNSIQDEMHERLDDSFHNIFQFTLKNQRINYMFITLDTVVSTAVQLLLFIYGGREILSGRFTIGMFTMFSSYFGMMMSSIKYFINLSKSYQSVLVSYDRLSKINNQPEESNGENIIDHITKIEIKNLNFMYGEKSVLSKFNLTLGVGKIYCISGKNGIGKSTLLNLMMGLYIDEYSGQIFYNGYDIKDLNMINMRKKLIGFSEQEPDLIPGTFLFNLYLKNGIKLNPDSKLTDLINMLGLDNLIYQKSDGIYSEINEKSSNLSGGEKQKISILRVLLRNPDLIVLDEPTSAMDHMSIIRFMHYLNKIKKHKIILLVTHDESVRDMCDEIFRF